MSCLGRGGRKGNKGHLPRYTRALPSFLRSRTYINVLITYNHGIVSVWILHLPDEKSQSQWPTTTCPRSANQKWSFLRCRQGPSQCTEQCTCVCVSSHVTCVQVLCSWSLTDASATSLPVLSPFPRLLASEKGNSQSKRSGKRWKVWFHLDWWHFISQQASQKKPQEQILLPKLTFKEIKRACSHCKRSLSSIQTMKTCCHQTASN